MGMSLEQKQTVVSEIAAKLGNAQAVIVAEYRGLDVGRITDLRAKARNSGVYLRELKNTLARRAVTGTPFEKLADQLVGPLIYGIAQDPVAGAKALSEFAKDNEKFVIKGGAMANSLMSAKDIKTLATMPRVMADRSPVKGPTATRGARTCCARSRCFRSEYTKQTTGCPTRTCAGWSCW